MGNVQTRLCSRVPTEGDTCISDRQLGSPNAGSLSTAPTADSVSSMDKPQERGSAQVPGKQPAQPVPAVSSGGSRFSLLSSFVGQASRPEDVLHGALEAAHKELKQGCKVRFQDLYALGRVLGTGYYAR